MNYNAIKTKIINQKPRAVSDLLITNVMHENKNFRIMDTREILERANEISKGQFHTIYYFKTETQKGLSGMCRIIRYRVMFADYESMTVVKELRAGGVVANNPSVQNEQPIPTRGGAPVLWYNPKTDKTKIRVPLVGGEVQTVYIINGKEVSKDDYFKEWQSRGYALPSKSTGVVQPFRSLDVQNILCLN